MRFVIADTGLVRAVRVLQNSLPDCAAVSCMREVFQGMTFPVPDPPGEVTVIYPIMYQPG